MKINCENLATGKISCSKVSMHTVHIGISAYEGFHIKSHSTPPFPSLDEGFPYLKNHPTGGAFDYSKVCLVLQMICLLQEKQSASGEDLTT